MKKLLLIILSISFFSCNNNYKDAEELYNQGVDIKSKSLLNQATLKLDMIREHHKDFNQAKLLNNKIDSVKNYWLIAKEEKIEKELDSINKINSVKLERLKIKENKMYPSLSDSVIVIDYIKDRRELNWFVDDSGSLALRNSCLNEYYELEKLLVYYEVIMKRFMPSDIFKSYEKSKENWNKDKDIFVDKHMCGATKVILSTYYDELIDLRIRQVLIYFQVYLDLDFDVTQHEKNVIIKAF